jgi:hypothetical protein
MLRFEENLGQTEASVRFTARQGRWTLLFRDREISMRSPGKPDVTLRLVKATKPKFIEGLIPAGISSYFVGSAKNWRPAIPAFEKVRYASVYPGIDLVFYGRGNQIEYDFVLAPGADPSRIEMRVSGPVRLTSEGGLEVGEGMTFAKPALFQGAESVDGRYEIRGRNRVGFAIGRYDAQRQLVIDPVLNYSAVIGSSGVDDANAIAVDGSGSTYVTGSTGSLADFPSTPGALRGSGNSATWAFVYKLNAAGTAIVYSATVGGTTTLASNSSGSAIAVDGAGNAYVAGQTSALDFPTTVGAFQGPPAQNQFATPHGFVLKLNATGTALIYSTYLRSNFTDLLKGIAIDSSGNAYIAGQSASTFPTTSGAFQTGTVEGNSAFVTKLNSTGTALVYSTFLAGVESFGQGSANAIAVDSSGHAYVAGTTTSQSFPATSGAFQGPGALNSGSGIGFATKISADGSSLVYSTWLSGIGVSANGVAVDNAGAAYLAGTATFLAFPNLLATDPTGGLFVSKLSADGSTMLYTRVVGGSTTTSASAVALDPAGNAWICGQTTSSSYPLLSPVQTILGSPNESTPSMLISAFDPTGALLFSTLFAGQSYDKPNGIAIDSNANAYVAGRAASNNFPVTTGAAGKVSTDGFDTFVLSLSNATTCGFSLSSAPGTFPAAGANGSVAVTTSPGCNWLTVSNAFWLSLTGNPSNSGSGNVTFALQPNITPARSTTVSVAGQGVIISQANGCTYQLSQSVASVPAGGNPALSISLITGGGCQWTFSTPPLWAPLISGGPHDSSTQFIFDVSANTDPNPRSATMTIAGQPFVIDQAGGFSCGFSLDRTGGTYGSMSTLDSFNVTTTSTCAWSAVSTVPWLHVDLVASTTGNDPVFGMGSGFVNIRLDSNNSGEPRTGKITIAGISFTVNQLGASMPTKVGIWRPSVFNMVAQDVNGNIAWDTGVDRAAFFGATGDIVIFGDWDGSGTTKMGIFRPSVGMFALDMNGNGAWDPGIDTFGFFGQNGDIPIVGDWTGDGKSKIGIFRPSTGLFALDINNNQTWDPGIDQAGKFGQPNDVPIVGKWTMDGKSKVGIFRNGLWELDTNGDLIFESGGDATGTIGQAGDVPLVGDWNGDGRTKVGIYRPGSAIFGLDYNGNLAWDNGIDLGGLLGPSGATPVVGDWTGTGISRVGIFYGNGYWALDTNGNLTWDSGIKWGAFGAAGDTPVVGKWQ